MSGNEGFSLLKTTPPHFSHNINLVSASPCEISGNSAENVVTPTSTSVSQRQSNLPYFQFTRDHLGALGVGGVGSSPTNVQNYSKMDVNSTVIPASFENMASVPPTPADMYHPVFFHWFYSEGKVPTWKPFSFSDSLNLEDAFSKGEDCTVPTDGGRYDVLLPSYLRKPVYWPGNPMPVRRCSWFRRGYNDQFPIPYSEDIAEKLEAEYRDAMLTRHWHRQVVLPGGDRVLINSAISMQHYPMQETNDFPSSVSNETQAPQTVKRGMDDFVIQDGSAEQVDHILFLIHGIGSVCDLKFRSVEECVDDFRAMGEELVGTHFKDAVESGQIGRVEILPIAWHKALHGEATGLDEKLKLITLRSIPKFREFINDTLLDVLFFTSPVYCQHIMERVASEMERLYILFKERNPTYSGAISLGGHSLGSVILFDLLMHQNETSNNKSTMDEVKGLEAAFDNRSTLTSSVNFEIGTAGTGQPSIVYPQLSFNPQAFFMMGSPVGMFVTVRGIDTLGPSFKLPTCKKVFNIFHPFDPVAYRLETILDPSLSQLRPILIPHHKGRKRMHLELKDTLERVGSDLKNLVFDSIQSTWKKVSQLYSGEKTEEEALTQAEADFEPEQLANYDQSPEHNVYVGEINEGRRVDYVLQEKPYESFTEYVFALQAHLTYWTSEDTLLLILKELYSIQNVYCDAPSKVATPKRGPSRDESSRNTAPSTSYNNPHNTTPLETTVPPPAMVPLNPEPKAPIPLFDPTAISPSIPPTNIPTLNSYSNAKSIGGRPLFDPSSVSSFPQGGVDPTASPKEGVSIAPPPMAPNISFSRKFAKK